MKTFAMSLLGLCVWGGLLALQGTPTLTEDVAAEAVQAMHPQAEIYNVTTTQSGDASVYKVAYVEDNGGTGTTAISAETGSIVKS